MSKVVARYFQKCDMCNQEFQLECEKQNWGRLYYLAGLFRAMAADQHHC